MKNYKGWDAIQRKDSQGIIGSSWIRQIMAAYDSINGEALEEFPYLEYWITQDYVDRKWIAPMVNRGFERAGFGFVLANARFSNPAGLGRLYEAIMRAPSLRHGVGVLAFNANEFDKNLSYSFSNYRSAELQLGDSWVVSYSYQIGFPRHEQISVVIQAAALLKYFASFHGERPLPNQVWVELNLPEHDIYLLSRELGVPVSLGPANRIYIESDYASRESLHAGPNRWAEVVDDTADFNAKNWAGKIAMTISCWDYTAGNQPTVDDVAEQLNMTAATLRNRLKPDYLLKDVMKEAEMRRVKNSLENGLSIKDAQTIYSYSNLRDLKACYKKYIGDDIERSRRAYVKNISPFF